MTLSAILANLLWSLFRLAVILGGIAASFFYFAAASAIATNTPIPEFFTTVGWVLVTCAILSTLITMLNPQTLMRAGPLSIFAPMTAFEKTNKLMTAFSRAHTTLFWAWTGLFVWSDYTLMPKVGAIAFLILTPLAWQHAINALKAHNAKL